MLAGYVAFVALGFGLNRVRTHDSPHNAEAPARPLGGRGGDKPSPARPLNAEAIEKQRQVRLIVFATPISHVVCPVSAFNFRLRRCLPVSVGPLRLLRQPPVQASSELLLLLLPHLCKRLLVSALSL